MAAAIMFVASACGSGEKNKCADSITVPATESQPVAESHAGSDLYTVTDGRLLSKAGNPMVVDFYADWCPPCRQMKPLFESFAQKYGNDIDFVSINVDEQQDLAAAYGVESIPMFLFVASDGTVVNTIVGAVSGNVFESSLASSFPMQTGK